MQIGPATKVAFAEGAPLATQAPAVSRRPTYEGVQCLRFVAAALVVLTHSTFYVQGRLDPSFPLWSVGTAGVDIFFVISGFVVYYTSRPRAGHAPRAAEFYLRRLIRIVPAYWLVTTIVVAVKLAAPSLALHASSDFVYILKSYFFVPAYNEAGRIEPILGVGWTLLFEMFFYSLFAIALWVRVNPIALCSAVLVPCAALSFYREPNWPAAAVYFNPIVLEFLAGLIIAHYADRLRITTWGAGTLAAAALIALLILPQVDHTFGVWGDKVVPATLVVLGVVGLEGSLAGRFPKSLVFLGSISYSLYLVHPVVSPAPPLILAKMGLVWPWASIVLSAVVAVAVAVVMYRMFEKPVTSRLNRWAARSFARDAQVNV